MRASRHRSASAVREIQRCGAPSDRLEAHYNHGVTVAFDFVDIAGGAKSLVYYLRKGLTLETQGVERYAPDQRLDQRLE